MSVLRQWFGPSKGEIWQQLCAAINAQYVAGGFGKGDRVVAQYGGWMVTLDTYTVSHGKHSTTYTRIRAPYVNPDGFRFTVHRKSLFSDLGKWLGMQDVNVGCPEFDEAFIIKGTDENKLRELFANQKIRGLILAQPDIHFSVTDNTNRFWGRRALSENTDELHFQAAGVIKDVKRLEMLFWLFAETRDELCRMGSAYENKPPVKS